MTSRCNRVSLRSSVKNSVRCHRGAIDIIRWNRDAIVVHILSSTINLYEHENATARICMCLMFWCYILLGVKR